MNNILARVAYELNGVAGAPVVALVHGLGLARGIWSEVETALRSHYRVLNYDLFGHGDSAPPPAPPSLTLFSHQLRDLLDMLAIDRCAVVGFSLGGMINRRFALDMPNRVTALAILNSPHERGAEAQRQVEARAAASAKEGVAAGLDETLARWLTPEFRATRADVVAAIRRRLLANDASAYAQCRQVLAHGVRELIRPAPPITCPTLIATCENDSGSTPAMAHAIAAEIPNAEVVVIPRLRHLGLVEEPEAFVTPLLRFLQRCNLGA